MNKCEKTKKVRDHGVWETNRYTEYNKRSFFIEANIAIARQSLAIATQELEILRYETLLRELEAEMEIVIHHRDIAYQNIEIAHRMANRSHENAKGMLKKLMDDNWYKTNKNIKMQKMLIKHKTS